MRFMAMVIPRDDFKAHLAYSEVRELTHPLDRPLPIGKAIVCGCMSASDHLYFGGWNQR